MEAQMHRAHGHDYDDPFYPAGNHGGVVHKDEAETVNDSAVVRSGLAEPTVMGTPVLAEDLYATHGGHYYTYGGDVNREPLKGSFGNPTGFEDEGRYCYGAPPPLSTGYETHPTDKPHVGQNYSYGQDVNREPSKGSVANPTGMEEGRYCGGVYGTHPGGDHVYADEGEKELGITGVLHSLDKMKVFDEPDTESIKSDLNGLYTGSHDQFAPEPANNPPLDTIAANPSSPNSSYTQKISSATSALADKAEAVKDSIVSKLSSSGENKTDTSTMSHKNNTKSSFPTAFSHKVADTLSSTLGPVYEKVTSKMHGPGHDETAGSPVVAVKEYLVDTFKPGDDDKVLSEAITHAFHRGKGNQRTQETTTTTYVVKGGERRLQDSGN